MIWGYHYFRKHPSSWNIFQLSRHIAILQLLGDSMANHHGRNLHLPQQLPWLHCSCLVQNMLKTHQNPCCWRFKVITKSSQQKHKHKSKHHVMLQSSHLLQPGAQFIFHLGSAGSAPNSTWKRSEIPIPFPFACISKKCAVSHSSYTSPTLTTTFPLHIEIIWCIHMSVLSAWHPDHIHSLDRGTKGCKLPANWSTCERRSTRPHTAAASAKHPFLPSKWVKMSW